ncbi:hypothetical protein LIER_44120 [Lithospermum erythrorhizon]|uniref:Uncharacterized protein n=1 Tax=Lithospermum erythrorhizon TaxID=34254 RepID=A0AAV3PX13_LITER
MQNRQKQTKALFHLSASRSMELLCFSIEDLTW